MSKNLVGHAADRHDSRCSWFGILLSTGQTLLISCNYFFAVPTVRMTCLAVLFASSRPAESIRAITVSSRHCRCCSTVRADLALCTACQRVVRTVQTLSVCTLITPTAPTCRAICLGRAVCSTRQSVAHSSYTTAGIRPTMYVEVICPHAHCCC